MFKIFLTFVSPTMQPLLTRKTTHKLIIQTMPYTNPKMVIPLSKKKSRQPKRAESRGSCCCSFLAKLLVPIPTALFFLILVFLWSSTTTIISGRIVHVCVSSRKLNNLYCLSAGTQKPNFDFPIPLVNSSSVGHDLKDDSQEVVDHNPIPLLKKTIINERGDRLPRVSLSNSSSISRDLKADTQEVAHVVLENPIPVLEKGIINNRGEEYKNAVKVVEEQLRVHRTWRSNVNHPSCEGRGIYVYDLPPKFNKDLVSQCDNMIPWVDFCKYFSNDALGEPIKELGNCWYQTHQYSLELIFHSRVSKHPCRVYDQNEAKLFYVPFYGGLDILRWHFKNVSNEVKDSLALELVNWLEMQMPWDKNLGRDHVLVLGKISWDFRRTNYSSWGTRLLELDQMQNLIKLLIERQPWEIKDVGIPHPTHFHPRSDDDIISWQLRVIQSNRKSLVSFAGATRPSDPDNIRSVLINQCTSTTTKKCRFLNCSSGVCDRPKSIIGLFMESEFCLQPPGDSPTRKSVFDSLISGCIPVFFDPFTAYYQYPWHLPEDHGKYSVFVDQEEVREMKVHVVERLMKVPLKEREDMRRFIVYELLPGLVYGDPNANLEKFQDAFAITINNLLERVTKLD